MSSNKNALPVNKRTIKTKCILKIITDKKHIHNATHARLVVKGFTKTENFF